MATPANVAASSSSTRATANYPIIETTTDTETANDDNNDTESMISADGDSASSENVQTRCELLIGNLGKVGPRISNINDQYTWIEALIDTGVDFVDAQRQLHARNNWNDQKDLMLASRRAGIILTNLDAGSMTAEAIKSLDA